MNKMIDYEQETNERLTYLAYLNDFAKAGSSIASLPQNYKEELQHCKICYGKGIDEEKECLPLDIISAVSNEIKATFDHLDAVETTKIHVDTSRKLILSMQQTYETEGRRNREFLNIINPLLALTETMDVATVYEIRKNYGPDGYKTVPVEDNKNALIAIFEGKLEIGCCGDPSLQACFDYSKYCGQMAAAGIDGHYPCLLLTLAGCQVTVSLALVAKTIFVCPLIDALLFQGLDRVQKGAKVLASIEKAMNRLVQYYNHNEWMQPENSLLSLPFYIHINMKGVQTRIHYTQNLKLQPCQSYVFLAEIEGTRQKIVVKFTRHYCEQAHQLLSDHHYAPTLHSVQQISDEWKMVVMDYIPDSLSYFRLYSRISNPTKIIFRNQLLDIVNILHHHGYAHGDLRRPNVLLVNTDEPRVYIIDYDWCGPIGNVLYPDNIDLGQFPWIQTTDLPLATQEHDTMAIQNIIKDFHIE